ncbi:MAG TPA: adenosine kinase, partial [Acidimicrobiales bacterium]|nr:adenosine kinase [Acidimicrobiales bacterium]
FVHDIRSAGVLYQPAVAAAGSAGDAEALGTGRCLVLVSDDGERTMATHLGAATTIAPGDVPEDLVARAQIVYLEGYLWDLPPAKEAMRRAMALAHDHDGSVALSLSDPFCVDRHQREFLDLLLDDVDVLFGNEEEITRLFGTNDLDAALEAAEETGLLVAVTLGAKGSVVTTARGPVAVPAVPVPAVVDTTGAGDLYAAGFLYGLTHGSDPEGSAKLGALCAGEVIGHLGARPQADLRVLATGAGLL